MSTYIDGRGVRLTAEFWKMVGVMIVGGAGVKILAYCCLPNYKLSRSTEGSFEHTLVIEWA